MPHGRCYVSSLSLYSLCRLGSRVHCFYKLDAEMRSDIGRQQMAENFVKPWASRDMRYRSALICPSDISRPQQNSIQHSNSLTNVKLSSANDRSKPFVALNMMHSSGY